LSPRPPASTRDRILKAALGLFRKHGFDQTTMRDVAKAAHTSLGAAYYYFPSKEALVLAHWQSQMQEQERRTRAALAERRELADRLRAVLRIRFELMKHDRRLLVGLFRGIADVKSAVSVFSTETSELRARAVRLFEEALDLPSVPEDLREAAALGLWVLQLALVLYFIHDDSPGQQKTLRLGDGAIDLLLPLVPLLALEPARAWRTQLIQLLSESGLWPAASGTRAERPPR
jgi:AcrR family transcriptional regulator